MPINLKRVTPLEKWMKPSAGEKRESWEPLLFGRGFLESVMEIFNETQLV